MIKNMDICDDIDRPPCSFVINHDSFTDRQAYRPFLRETCLIFTDGSKARGKVGAAFVVMIANQVISSNHFRLADTSSVFQAELFAIKQAALYIASREIGRPIWFFVDSQASLRALLSETIRSRLVFDMIRCLNDIRTNVNLIWVPAHTGVIGNELADALAKDALNLLDVHEVPIPKIVI